MELVMTRFNLPSLPVWVISLALLLGAGCQSYHPNPLPNHPDLQSVVPGPGPVTNWDLPGFKPRPIQPDALDWMAVVTLAVLNNPDLKAARAGQGLAAAQVLEAGLLPDPVLSGGPGESSRYTGYAVGLSEDIQALITRGAAKKAAQAHSTQVHLDILWQELQVAQKAETLFIQATLDQSIRPSLLAAKNLQEQRYRQDAESLRRGDLALPTVTADLAAMADADAALQQLDLDECQTLHDLHALLGLAPNAPLHLEGKWSAPMLSRDAFRRALDSLPNTRADLLALQAGYQSQEESLRQAVLAQFPAMTAGVEQGRDPVEGVQTIGLSGSITLPLFNRNQGQIAIQKATREALRQAYQARLDQSIADADQLWSAIRIQDSHLKLQKQRLPLLRDAAQAADSACRKGEMDLSSNIGFQSQFGNAQVAFLQAQAALARQQAALYVLLGLPFVSANPPRELQGRD